MTSPVSLRPSSSPLRASAHAGTRWTRGCDRRRYLRKRPFTSRVQAKTPQRENKDDHGDITLNPVELGRRSRQAIDDVWAKVTGIAGSRASFNLEDDLGADMSSDTFSAPQAAFTRVLVVGGTGRVGRIVVRKLLLRGYSVTVMCRDTEASAREELPTSVKVVQGDVANLSDCRKAIEGIDKVVYCAASTADFAAVMNRVENVGVGHVARAWMDGKHKVAAKAGARSSLTKSMAIKFSNEQTQDEWNIMHCGPLDEEELGYRGQDFGNAYISEDLQRLAFTGSVYSQSGIAEWGGPVDKLVGPDGRGEGFVFNVLSDGKTYYCFLVDSDGNSYYTLFGTRLGYNNVRLTSNMFQAEQKAAPPLDMGKVVEMRFRYDKSLLPQVDPSMAGREADDLRRERNSFNFELDWVKVLPTADEPNFVLLSCAGTSASAPEMRRIGAKRRGEQALRNSGISYMIVRPNQLEDEPGGYRALVFDQGNRIRQGIGYADLADVCLKGLHAFEAVNKTFEVCYEYTPEGVDAVFELVAHTPDATNNYLAPALAPFERNT